MTKRILGAALALTSVLGLMTTAGYATARPATPTKPGGLSRAQAARAATTPTGDCADAGVTCKPPNVTGSCAGNTSQTTPPASIRVYDPTYTGANHIRVVPFETYVEEVLPNEWAASWDGDALKAGAVAVTSYAWFWATHFGGYVGTNSPSTCFDVTHDTNFQKFANGSAQANSTSKVQQVFPSAIRRNGAVIEASYLADLNPNYNPNAAHPVLDTCGEDADGTTLSQDGSQACNQDNTGNKWPVILKLYYGSSIQIASTAQLRTQHDFQYLHRSTEVTFNAGKWSINDGYPTTISFGTAGDVPVVNTVGDGFARVAVFRPSTGTWYLGTPTGGIAKTFTFGAKGDIPVAGQYQGLTAPTQVAVFRPSTGVWYLSNNAGGIASTVAYGTKGDIPVPADYNGDGSTDIAVYRPSTSRWYIRGVSGSVPWGTKGDIPVTGDFTGDGKADLAVYRPSNHTWYVRGGSTTTFGSSGATPIGKAPYVD